MSANPYKIGWRLANRLVLEVKAGLPNTPASYHAWTTLKGGLEELITHVALDKHQKAPVDTVFVAVAKALDVIRSCKCYHVSSRYLNLLLLESFRVTNEPLPADFEESVLPEWYLALDNLLDLSHRSWTYLRLAAARGVFHGYQGRLAKDYLGPSRDAMITRHAAQRRQVARDQFFRYSEMEVPEGGDGPIEELFWALNQQQHLFDDAADRDADQPATPERRVRVAREVLRWIIKKRPDGGYACAVPDDDTPDLSKALDEVAERLGRIPDVAARAAHELSREICEPGSVLHNAPAIPAVLDQLPVEHRNDRNGDPIERPPANVLAAINAYPLPNRPAREEVDDLEVIPRGEMAEMLMTRLPENSPERWILAGMLVGVGSEMIRSKLRELLRERMLEDKAKTTDVLQRCVTVLRQWYDLIERVTSAQRMQHDDNFRWLEIPNEAWDHPPDIEDTWKKVELYVEADAVDGGSPSLEEILCWEEFPLLFDALYCVIVEDIADQMTMVYRRPRVEERTPESLSEIA